MERRRTNDEQPLAVNPVLSTVNRCSSTVNHYPLREFILKQFQVCLSTILILGVINLAPNVGAKTLRVRMQQWLEVRQLFGTVMFARGNYSRPAQVGTRLQHVGDTIRTGRRSSTVLAIDTEVGFVSVSSDTVLQVQQLQATADGGKLTRLKVVEGQARFQVKRLRESGTGLEIQTPAGSSAVRGTEFGVNVHPDGKTGIVTIEGSVVTSAQGKSVTIDAGYQSFLVPGEPPSDPIPATDSTRLQLRFLAAQANGTAHVVGQIDPVNLLLISDARRVVDRNGRFEVVVPLPADRRITAVVITPSGKRERYELAVP